MNPEGRKTAGRGKEREVGTYTQKAEPAGEGKHGPGAGGTKEDAGGGIAKTERRKRRDTRKARGRK